MAYVSTELNQHRRHDGGVTRQTTGERQVGEVERIHAQFRQQFGDDDEIERKQAAYVAELRDQFGLRQSEPTG